MRTRLPISTRLPVFCKSQSLSLTLSVAPLSSLRPQTVYHSFTLSRGSCHPPTFTHTQSTPRPTTTLSPHLPLAKISRSNQELISISFFLLLQPSLYYPLSSFRLLSNSLNKYTLSQILYSIISLSSSFTYLKHSSLESNNQCYSSKLYRPPLIQMYNKHFK